MSKQKPQKKISKDDEKSAEQKKDYEVYLDDSSDEEIEAEIVRQAPKLKAYNKAAKKIGEIALCKDLHGHDGKDLQKITNYFNAVKTQIKGLIVNGDKVSTNQKFKSKIGDIKPKSKEEAIHSALKKVFGTKGLTELDFIKAIKAQYEEDKRLEQVNAYFKRVTKEGIKLIKDKVSYNKKVKRLLKEVDWSDDDEDQPIHGIAFKEFKKLKDKEATSKDDFVQLVAKKYAAEVKQNELKDGNDQIDLKLSLIHQDLGIRLFISKPVTDLHFPHKQNVFPHATELPGPDEVASLTKKAITEVVKSLEIEKAQKKQILASGEYKDLNNSLTEDMRKIFKLDRVEDEFKTLASKIREYVEDDDEAGAAAKDRHIEIMVNYIAKEAKTDGGSICIAKNIKTRIIASLPEKFRYYSKAIIKAVGDAYKSLEQARAGGDLLASAKRQVRALEKDEGDEDSDPIFTNLITSFEMEVETRMKEVERPTLPYAISRSCKDINPEADQYGGFKDLCSYLRITNCSAKRFIKNIKKDDFDGAEFSRAWSFNGNLKFFVIENVSVSASLSLSQMIQYPNKSSYSLLLQKLKSFLDKGEVSEESSAACIKEILKTGKAGEDVALSKSFEQFLTIFAYHLFGTEVQRHPAAALHHAMALDLIINEHKDWGWVINHLPMALEKACPVIRFLQTTLRPYLPKPYFYNNQGETLSREDKEVQEFMIRERELTEAWLESKDLDTTLDDDGLKALGELCEDFYGINVVE